MCVLCVGRSEQELLLGQLRKVKQYGFTMIAVTGERPWTYTIGLAQTLGHPELVVTGLPDCCASTVMNRLVDRIREGERFGAESPDTELEGWTVRFRSVHPGQ